MEKCIIVFVVLFVVNIMMMTLSYIYIRKSQDKLYCSVSDFLTSAVRFLDHNGAKSFENVLPDSCSDRSSSLHFQKLEKSFHTRVRECRQQQGFSLNADDDENRPLITLFTSWKSSPEKYLVHNSTLMNWSSFIPKVKLVLFTNDSALRTEAITYGWTVFHIIHHVEGMPVLKHMFQKVISSFNSTFYGYSNSDILYTDSLLESLRVVNRTYGSENLFLTGRRTNIPHLSLKEVVSYDNIRRAAASRGELFVVSSEDYFLTTSRFHWNKVPELIIGRPAFDNWLVGYARCHFYHVIDMTDTVLACHQTTKAGNKEGLHHKTLTAYNHKLLTKFGITTHYEAGYIICPKIKTYYSLCGNIELTDRPINKIPKYCSCKSWK